MKSFTLLFIGLNLLFNNSVIEPNTADVLTLKVIENRTDYNGVYYHYEIKNTGNKVIPARSYNVFLKVDGKTVSFDKSTSELKPGQTVKYEPQKTFYKKDSDFINYTLAVSFKDSKIENTIISGQSKL